MLASRRSLDLGVAAGAVVALLGSIVLAGWIFRIEAIVQLRPSLAPMQWNTACAFLLSGVALVLSGHGRHGAALMCVVWPIASGALTVLQYRFGIDLGIDRIVFDPYITVQTSSPGRMAPVTALCFLIGGLALAGMQIGGQPRTGSVAAGISGSLVATIGLIVLVSQLGGVSGMLEWGAVTRMAGHTAAGMMVFGFGLVALAWPRTSAVAPDLHVLRRNVLTAAIGGAAILVVVTTVLVTMPLFAQLREARRAELAQAVATRTAAIEQFLQRGKSIATQIASRREAYQLLEAYGRGVLSRDSAARLIGRNLSDAWRSTSEIAGITRLADDGTVLTAVGLPIPAPAWPTNATGDHAAAGEPFPLDSIDIVVASAPVWSGDSTRMGTDLIALRLDAVAQRLTGGFTAGESFIAVQAAGKRRVFAVNRGRLVERSLPADSPGGRAAEAALGSRAAGLISGVISSVSGSEPMIAAYSPIRDSKWAVVMETSEQDVYAGLRRNYIYSAAGVLALAVIGGAWLFALVRPLTGMILMQADTLQEEIREKTGELEHVLGNLRSTELKYRSIFENATEGVFQTAPDGTMLAANPALARMLGYASPDELIRRQSNAARGGYVDSARRSDFERLMAEHGAVRDFEFVHHREDGSTMWVSENSRAVRNGMGEILYYEGTLVDITQRKRATEQLEEAKNAAVASETKFRSVADSAADAIVGADAWGAVISWNRSAERMFGYRLEEIVGKPVALLMPERYRAAHAAGIERMRRAGESRVIGRTVELEGLRKDGAEFPLELSLGAWKTPNGACFSGIMRDVTERRQAQDALRQAKAAAEEANQAKSRFLANMSHELRTPLNSVIGFAGILLKNKRNALAAQELTYLERIHDNGRHLLGLIDDVLDLSKIEAGHADLEVAPTALDALVREVISELESHLRDDHVALVADVPVQMVPLLTNRGKLKQVLINLVGNALKFTERGEVTVRVATDPATAAPVRIDVADTGIGIPAERQAAVFEAFQQADTSTRRKYGGTGLGLAISQSLAIRMGNRLSLVSEAGAGSTFSIHLAASPPTPAAPGPVSSAPAIAPAGISSPTELAVAGKLALVVDDEADDRLLISTLLAEEGYDVLTAASGREGLLLVAGRPDVVVLDLLMDEVDGETFLEIVRNNPRYADLPIVVVTAKALTPDDLRRLSAKASAVLGKNGALGDDLKRALAAALAQCAGAADATRLRPPEPVV